MKYLKIIALPLLIFSLASCSTSETSSSVTSTTNSSNSESSESSENSIEESSSSSSEREIVVSSRNPMNEPDIHQQYYLNHIGDIYSTWKTYQGHGVTIAVIDRGFKYDHQDFNDENGNSKVSELSASFTTSGTTTTKTVGRNKVSGGVGTNAHGTFCAGVAAGGINGKGIIGIAPLAELMLLKTDGHPYSICEAFKYAADNGAKVITISIGSYADDYEGDLEEYASTGIHLDTVFNDAVQYCLDREVAVISAAGNGGQSAHHSPTDKTYPGATPGVIGAAGLAKNSSSYVWEGSSYNSTTTLKSVDQDLFCDVFSPSDGMYGITDHYRDAEYYSYDGNWDGTSFASPTVAGIAALYFEKNPDATVDEFKHDLYSNSHIFNPENSGISTKNIGHGRVDVGALLGTTTNEEITIKIKNTGMIKAYMWNSLTGAQKSAWPGNELSKQSGYYNVTVDTSKYDSIIFNNYTTATDEYGIKTVDLYASSFSYDNIYDLDFISEDRPFIGKYIAN